MTDTVRCPECRGSKKVAKLGGIVGECNTCKGTGTIEAAAKFVAPVLEELPMDKLVIDSVASVAPNLLHEQDEPITQREIKQAPVPSSIPRELIQKAAQSVSDTKTEPKRKVFQRKK